MIRSNIAVEDVVQTEHFLNTRALRRRTVAVKLQINFDDDFSVQEGDLVRGRLEEIVPTILQMIRDATKNSNYDESV